MVLAHPATTDTANPLGEDPPIGPLVFRIRGTRRNGQLIRLCSRKCTVGSGMDCTLRLDAYGVRPLHCLILRGRRASIVRRWGPDTLLNGQSFSDAELRTGDCLRIGPIELEVVQTTDSPSATQAFQPSEFRENPKFPQIPGRLEMANRQGRTRTRQAVAALRRARQEVTRLETLHRELTRTRSGEDETGQKRQHESEAQLVRQRQEYETAQREFNAQQQALLENQQRWTAQREAEQAELSREKQTLKQLQTQLATERALLERELQTQKTRLRDFEVQRKTLEEACRQWETQRANGQAQTAASAGQLEAQRTEWETRRRELDEAQAKLDESQTKLEESQAKLNETQTQLDEARAKWARQCEEEKTQHEQRLADLERREARLVTQQEQSERQARQREDDARRVKTQFETQHEAFLAEQKNWEATREAFLTEQEEWNTQRNAEEERLREWEARLEEARRQADSQARREEKSVAESASRSTASRGGAPVSVSAVLGQLGAVALVPDEEEEENKQPSLSPSRRTPVESPAGRQPPESTEGEGEDDSIDAYMARLMERVRSASGDAPPASQAPAEPKQPKREPAKPAKTSTTEPVDASPVSQGPVTLTPRRTAVEDPNQLSAMRELASGAAQTAIDQHAQKVLRYAILNKLLITISAALCGLALVAGWFLLGLNDTSYYTGLICILLSVTWGIQYAVLTGRLIGYRYRAKDHAWCGQTADSAEASTPPIKPADAAPGKKGTGSAA